MLEALFVLSLGVNAYYFTRCWVLKKDLELQKELAKLQAMKRLGRPLHLIVEEWEAELKALCSRDGETPREIL